MGAVESYQPCLQLSQAICWWCWLYLVWSLDLLMPRMGRMVGMMIWCPMEHFLPRYNHASSGVETQAVLSLQGFVFFDQTYFTQNLPTIQYKTIEYNMVSKYMQP